MTKTLTRVKLFCVCCGERASWKAAPGVLGDKVGVVCADCEFWCDGNLTADCAE